LTLFRFFVYSIAQFIGSFLGAVVCYLVYYDSLKVFKAGMYSLDTAGIFATYPNANLSVFGGFLDQTVGTMILVLVVLALNDKRNSKVANYAGPVLVGITLITIGLGYGYNSGYALNPTRDLAPRCFTLIAGWGTKTVSYIKK